MLPLAPGRLSTMNCCFSPSASPCASRRAYKSVPPPGEEGTTSLTERVGHASCAKPGIAGNARTSAITVALFMLPPNGSTRAGAPEQVHHLSVAAPPCKGERRLLVSVGQ